MKTKRILSLTLALIFCGTLFSCSGQEKKNDNDNDKTNEANKKSKTLAELTEQKEYVQIEMESGGLIVLELYPLLAPITVENFLKLVDAGFYNGLTFHRIDPDFMIQGGDPNGDGTGGSPDKIKGEFSENEVYNPLSHERGVISMARLSSGNDTASCQFFIVVKKSTFLDGKYAAFGKVIEGMDVVDQIKNTKLKEGTADTPVEKPVIKTIARIER